MKVIQIDPPREFAVGTDVAITLKDCARIELEPNEQVTFITKSDAEYDVVRKSWGFYATPSLNGRLLQFGWRAALVKSPAAKFYVFLLEAGKEIDFRRYLELEQHTVICWLDRDKDLKRIEEILCHD